MIVPPNAPTQDQSDSHAPPSARVQLSLSEINALCVRAARGAGLAWGEAEEAGWAASWLSQAGLSGPSITLAWLGDLTFLARPVPARDLWAATSGAQCPLRCGIALADFAGLPEGPGARPLTVETIAHPLMALPFVARAAARTGLDLRARWGDEDVSVHAAAAPSIPRSRRGDRPTDRRPPDCAGREHQAVLSDRCPRPADPDHRGRGQEGA